MPATPADHAIAHRLATEAGDLLVALRGPTMHPRLARFRALFRH